MGFNVLKVSRTKIAISGEFPADVAQALFEKVCGTQLASMRYEYDLKSDITMLNFYPCVVQEVDYDTRDKGASNYPSERRILMTGTIPAFVDFRESYWDGIVRDAKRQKTALRFVRMLPPKQISMPRSKIMTEISFVVDFDNGRINTNEALSMAVEAVSEKLQLISKDVNPGLMISAHVLDNISEGMRELLHKAEKDAVAERLAKYGNIYVDTDDMIFENRQGVSNR